MKPAAMAVEQRVYAEAQDREVRSRWFQNCARVRLLAEVEVRGDRVLEQVDAEVPHQDEQERVWRVRALGQHPDEGRRQHEAGPSSDEVAQGSLPAAVRSHDHERSGDVGRRRDRGEGEGAHHGPGVALLAITAIDSHRPNIEHERPPRRS